MMSPTKMSEKLHPPSITAPFPDVSKFGKQLSENLKSGKDVIVDFGEQEQISSITVGALVVEIAEYPGKIKFIGVNKVLRESLEVLLGPLLEDLI